jgi:hypothetical protein
MSEAAAQYKKKDGTVSVAVDGRTVSWTPTGGASPTVSIPLAELISMPPSQKPQRTLSQSCLPIEALLKLPSLLCETDR